MAAGTWTLYNNVRKKLVNGTMDLNAGVWRMKMYKGQAAASVSLSTLSTLTQLGTSNAAANMSSYPLVTFTVTAIAGMAGTGATGRGTRPGGSSRAEDRAMHEPAAYGLWALALVNSLVFVIFGLSFVRPRSPRDWRSLGAFAGFVVALFAEMYGFPLTIYLLSGF